MSISRHLSFTRTVTAALLANSLLVGLSGCGGGGGGGSATTPVSGSVFAAPVNGASCEIQRSNGIAVVGSITTDSAGLFSVNVPDSNLADDLMLVCSGGSYTDEASGSGQTAGSIAAYVAGGTLSASVGIHATPDSTIIHQLVTNHGTSLADANTTFHAAFGYTPDTTVAPTNATDPASGADDGELLAGLHAAAFSQLTTDLGLEPGQQFALLAALAQDLSNGAMDGSDASGTVNIDGDDTLPLPVDIQNQFAGSLLKFHGSTNNHSGLDNDMIGTLPFAKTTLTDSYKVEYVPGMMAAMQGKTQFKIRLTDRITDQAVTGAAVTLMPMMHMPDEMSHSTPVDGACNESGTAGTYDCTVYYLMASAMNGMSMGYWDLKVMIGGMMGESAYLYPPVMMAMGDTARATLKGVDDKIGSMMGMPEARTYYLFKSSLSGMNNNHSFQLFIAAKEGMMSYPAVYENEILDSGSDMIPDLTVNSMSVEVSTDKSTWLGADGSSNDGYWTATGITGLTNGSPGSIYVRMNINGEQKTTNGQTPAVDGTNHFATFTVTPGTM